MRLLNESTPSSDWYWQKQYLDGLMPIIPGVCAVSSYI